MPGGKYIRSKVVPAAAVRLIENNMLLLLTVFDTLRHVIPEGFRQQQRRRGCRA